MSKKSLAIYGLFVALWSLIGFAWTLAPTSWIGVGFGVSVAGIAWLRFQSATWRFGALAVVALLGIESLYKFHVNWTSIPADTFGIVFFAVMIVASAAALLASLRSSRPPELA